ncbi:MAG TPA: hypothetical protein VN903_36095 [Polyangia bacterium]|jgi:hypothetical protein|nr:hypothetical protein [Polyangia bacterium]
MPSPNTDDLHAKVRQLFAEGFGDAVHGLDHVAEEHLQAAVARAFELTDSSLDVAFHLSDWREDAAALLAISLAPEHFTPEEVEECLLAFLIHVPNHVLAAANLAGFPASDIFKTA